jgi:hypothetical protein
MGIALPEILDFIWEGTIKHNEKKLSFHELGL